MLSLVWLVPLVTRQSVVSTVCSGPPMARRPKTQSVETMAQSTASRSRHRWYDHCHLCSQDHLLTTVHAAEAAKLTFVMGVTTN